VYVQKEHRNRSDQYVYVQKEHRNRSDQYFYGLKRTQKQEWPIILWSERA